MEFTMKRCHSCWVRELKKIRYEKNLLKTVIGGLNNDFKIVNHYALVLEKRERGNRKCVTDK